MVERLVLLRTIDSLWVEHLTELDDMRRGIGLRGYAQQDPLNEFKKEAFSLYDELRGADPAPGRDHDLPGHGRPAAGPGGRSAPRTARPRRAPSPPRLPRGRRSPRRSAAGVASGAPHRPGGRQAGGGGRLGSARRAVGALAKGLPSGPAIRAMQEQVGDRRADPGRRAADPGAKLGRNDPCYCGSGLKYKKCHGR